jgi:hypothetical protein
MQLIVYNLLASNMFCVIKVWAFWNNDSYTYSIASKTSYMLDIILKLLFKNDINHILSIHTHIHTNQVTEAKRC